MVFGSDFEWNGSSWVRHAKSLRPDAVSFIKEAKGRRADNPAVRITNLSPNDAGLVENVRAEPNRVYEISGWIKTRSVTTARPDGIGACLCLWDTPVAGGNLRGDNPWTYVRLFVRTGRAPTVLPVACRLGFWESMAAGSAWFDDVRVRETTASIFDVVEPYPEPDRHRSDWSRFVRAAWVVVALAWVLWALWRSWNGMPKQSR